MFDAAETIAPPLTLYQQLVERVLASFRSEIESEAVAIARLLGDSILMPRHVERAAFNILHHHRLGPTLKDLMHDCDADGLLLMDDPDDWDSELEDDATDVCEEAAEADWDLDDRVGLTEDDVDG